MTDEEMAEEWCKENMDCVKTVSFLNHGCNYFSDEERSVARSAYLAGLKAGRLKWHKVADGDLPKCDDSFGKTSIHRKIYLKDRHGNLYTGNYYPKDESHREDCFAVEFLDWGFQGAQFCAKGQISEWCEIPQYTEE